MNTNEPEPTCACDRKTRPDGEGAPDARADAAASRAYGLLRAVRLLLGIVVALLTIARLLGWL